MSDPFYRPPQGGRPFMGGFRPIERTEGSTTICALTRNHYRMHIYLNGEERKEVVTADPDAGTIEIYHGTQKVTLKGYVEIKLERKLSS